MTAVNYYVSASVPSSERPYAVQGTATAGSINMGLSSYSSDPFELRITTGAANGPSSITKKDVVTFLRLVERWLRDQDSGLDYVISANSETVGIP